MDTDEVIDKPPRIRNPGNAGRVTKASAKRNYAKKRVHWKKKAAKADTTTTTPNNSKQTVSHSKIKKIKKISAKGKCEGFRFMDMEIMQDIISQLCCPNCFEAETLCVEEDEGKRKGLASHLCIYCKCGYTNYTYTSNVIEKKPNEEDKGGMKAIEINYRTVYATRSVGIDHSGLEIICGIMNMPKPMMVTNYNNISNVFRDTVKVVAEKSMVNSVDQLRKDENDVVDIGVSVDGTWQRCGFSSLNGVVAAISIDNDKVLDVEPLTRYCRECAVNKRKIQDSDALKLWQQNHCENNHEGSTALMESEGAVRIFSRSITNRKGRYVYYYGDGDSKAFSMVEDVYENTKVVKYECIGHYQKRVGCRLRSLKKRIKGLKPLTEAMIDKIQNYFGIALHANCTTVEEMSKGIIASFFHVSSSSKRNLHQVYCPPGNESWCRYQRDVANGTDFYKPGPGLSDDVIKYVKPIYLDLVKPEELKKCLHGKTQNQNESFNSLIWQRAPTHRYCGFNKLELAVYDSVAHFNDGKQALLDIFNSLNVNPGYHTTSSCITINLKRKRSSAYHNLASSKKARKIIRAAKKGSADKNKDKEGRTYKSGAV